MSSDVEGLAPPLIVYDGSCRFCQKQIERIRKQDRNGVFTCVPRQTPGLDERFPRLREGEFDKGMRLIHDEGEISVGADAVYEIARRMPGWRAIAWVYRVPVLKQLCRAVYGWVARNRSRLGGGCEDGACSR